MSSHGKRFAAVHIQRFEQDVKTAQEHIRKILDSERNAVAAADVPHTYADKFSLAEFCTRTALAACYEVLLALGLDEAKLKKIEAWHTQGMPVTLRYEQRSSCNFIGEQTREVESATKVKTTKKVFGITSKKTTSVVHEIKDYFFEVTQEWSLFAFAGTNVHHRVLLRSRKGSLKVRCGSRNSPAPTKKIYDPVDLNFTALLRISTSIDRADDLCRTPRRNKEVYAAIQAFSLLQAWADNVHTRIMSFLRFEDNSRPSADGAFKKWPLQSITAKGIFIPLMPLLEDRQALAVDTDVTPSPVLSGADVDAFLAEHKRTLETSLGTMAETFPNEEAAADRLISNTEASTCVGLSQLIELAKHYHTAMGYIEYMLYQQLEKAVGKVVTAADFDEYMKYHMKRLFVEPYSPRALCYAIRRPEHYPEGVIAIEQVTDPSKSAVDSAPLPTISRALGDDGRMWFSLNAATNVELKGPRYAHAVVLQQFTTSGSLPELNLSARARQFSSFILMMGTLAPENEFEPKHAIIIKDKDDLMIPLSLETIPTPKEFRDAIESLSPEQQEFAKAYRGMQLSGTLFALAVVQIKPQLEKLLRLPHDSLTKEIQLTQDLMELFIKYQIPSDLISYSPEDADEVTATAAIQAVGSHVKNIQKMIDEINDKIIQESKKKAANRVLHLSPPTKSIPPPPRMQTKYIPSPPMPMLGGPPPPMAMFGGPPPPPMPVSAPPPPMMSASVPAPPPMPTSAAPPPMPTSAAPPPKSAPVPVPPPVLPKKKKPSANKPKVANPATPAEPAPTPQTDSPEVEIVATDAHTSANVEDLTSLPAELDKKYDALDKDGALRPTIIKLPELPWTKRYQESVLDSPSTTMMGSDDKKKARNAAFDLLDALSRSGTLSIDFAELHVVVAATHRFARTVVDTVIMDNVNPIEKVERSMLIIATTIHRQPSAAPMLTDEHTQRVLAHSPALFPAAVADAQQENDLQVDF